MSECSFTDAELIAFIDEALPAERSSELESLLRERSDLRERLVDVRGRDTAGLHSVGAIWRRARLSCPSREDLGSYLMKALQQDHASYIEFHLSDIGCRYCNANLADLQSAADAISSPAKNEASIRRRKFFQTSAGHLK